jgi:hypothetical protein
MYLQWFYSGTCSGTYGEKLMYFHLYLYSSTYSGIYKKKTNVFTAVFTNKTHVNTIVKK